MIKSRVDLSTTRQVLAELITPEKHFIWVILIFGASISLLTLAVPVAIQYLINTIVNIGSFRAIGALAGTLFFVLAGYAALSAVRVWIVERYEQHLFARLASEVSYQVLSAPKNHFSDETNAGKSNRYFEILLLQSGQIRATSPRANVVCVSRTAKLRIRRGRPCDHWATFRNPLEAMVPD